MTEPQPERESEREALDEILAEMQAIHGPVDEAEVAERMDRLRDTEA